MTDPTFLTISELGALLQSRQVSSVELTRHYLGRLERVGPTYNAVVTVLREPAIAEAQERIASSPGTRGPPTSLELTGRPLGEAALLAVGMDYQERTNFHRLRPPGL